MINEILHVFAVHLPHNPKDFKLRNKCLLGLINSKKIKNNDSVVLLGDLNYRTNTKNPNKLMIDKVECNINWTI